MIGKLWKKYKEGIAWFLLFTGFALFISSSADLAEALGEMVGIHPILIAVALLVLGAYLSAKYTIKGYVTKRMGGKK